MPTNLYGPGDNFSLQTSHVLPALLGFEGTLRFDTSKPDGTPRKLLDTSKLSALGWTPRIELEAGIRSTYEWFLNHLDSLKI